MKLIGFGDSFTVGLRKDNLKRDKKGELIRPHYSFYHPYSYITKIKELLPDIFTESLILATPGAGSKEIFYKLVKYFHNHSLENVFVIIAWSHFHRTTYYYNEVQDEFEPLQKEQKELFYKFNLYSSLSAILEYESLILMAHEFLKQRNIKHMMIQAFCDHTNNYPDRPFVLGKEISLPYWLNWNKPNNTLFDIVRYAYCNPACEKLDLGHHTQGNFNNYKHLSTIAGCLHPTKEGHYLIAKTLKPYILEYVYTDKSLG